MEFYGNWSKFQQPFINSRIENGVSETFYKCTMSNASDTVCKKEFHIYRPYK